MTEATTATENPHLSVEEVGKRFLKLLGSIQTREDITKERIESIMGISLSLAEDEASYGITQNINKEWSFALNYRIERPSTKKGVDLHFFNEHSRFSDMSDICTLNYDYYDNALKKMGYESDAVYGEIGEIRSWRYYRNDIVISLIPQNRIPGKLTELCVQSIGTLN